MIKKILVPTDFSKCAQHATAVAIQLAQRFDAEIDFLHSMILPPKWHALTLEEKKRHPELTESFESTIGNLKSLIASHKGSNITMRYAYTDQPLIAKVNQYIDENDIDFVVMGSHGVSGFNELILGSNAQRVVRFAEVPVLIVKKEIKDFDIKNIVFASNFNDDLKPAFRKVLTLAAAFDAHINLLTIDTNTFFTQPTVLMRAAIEDFEALCPKNKVSTHIFSGVSVEEGIINFAKTKGVDLVCIGHHKSRRIKRLFWYSIVEALVNHAKSPVLSVSV